MYMPRDRDILHRLQNQQGQTLPDLSLSFARNVANGLLKIPDVLHVELFGSIARDEHGNDLCFLLVTGIEKYDEFYRRLKSVTDELKHKGYTYSSEEIRRMVISLVWNTHNPEWSEIQMFYQSNVHTDICVVPVGWREFWAITWLQLAFDDTFIEKLYAEARPIATRRN